MSLEFKIVRSKKSQRAEVKKNNSRYFVHSQCRKVERDVSVSENRNENITFAELCKGKAESCVVLGDSMVRGIVYKLKKDNDIFTGWSYGGAHIETITEELIGNRQYVEGRHVVLCVGTNNLKFDGTELIMDKYRVLLETLREKKCRGVSVLGIFYRRDVSNYLNSKRIYINERLADLCKEFNFDYISPRAVIDSLIDKSASASSSSSFDVGLEDKLLNRSGLRFNEWGQSVVAKHIFKDCVKHLNL